MISKHLAIAAAIVFLSAASVGQALAQSAPAQPAMTAPSGATTPAAGAPAAGAPGASMAAPAAATPAPAPAIAAPAPSAPKESPYGLVPLWKNGDFVIRTVIVLLGIMSAGTWYIFITKYLEQARVLGQAKTVERRFWSSNNLNEGIDKLPKIERVPQRRRKRRSSIGRSGHGSRQSERLDRHVAEPSARRGERPAAGRHRVPRVGRFDRAVRRSVRHRLGHSERPHRHRHRRPGVDRQGRRPCRYGA